MNVAMTARIAAKAIGRNPARSVLSCIGIGVGIAAVILAMAIGQGSKQMMVKEISQMGDNLVMVFPERRNAGAVSAGMGQGQTMTAGDAEAVKRELSHLVKGVSPQVRTSVQMMYASKNWSGNVQGVSTDVLLVSNRAVSEGRFFTEREQQSSSRVCVVGTTVVKNLFGEEDPVGKTIRLKDMTFRVVGVLVPKGANNWGQDQDDVIMAPYTSVQRFLQRSKFNNINMMNVSLVSMDDLEEAKREIALLLRQRHRLADWQDNDFEMRDTTEIMNIMLVSVTERTKEIGLRTAIGATPATILSQFVFEAVFLATVGGIIGVAAGVAGAKTVGAVMGWPILIETGSAVTAFVFSALVGMFFGFYPAFRASKLNPIDCLRYE